MKLGEAIRKIDELKHNTYTTGEKIAWLSEMDGNIKKLVIDTHEGGDAIPFDGYTVETDENTELLVPAPWDALYTHWLEAQIDYYNAEYDKYSNAAAQFNEQFRAFSDHYTRTHLPLPERSSFF